jgi:DNA repair protein RadC
MSLNSQELILADDEEALTTEELLALLLNSKNIAKAIIKEFGTLGSLEHASQDELLALPKMTLKKIAVLRALFALGRRRHKEPPFRGRPIKSSEDAFNTLNPLVRHEDREVFIALALDAKNKLIRSPIVVAIGSTSQAVIDPRSLLKPLLLSSAVSTIIAHNHPSSCPEPSQEDIDFTLKLFEACMLMGIKLFDHIVIGDGSYVSLAERGII